MFLVYDDLVDSQFHSTVEPEHVLQHQDLSSCVVCRFDGRNPCVNIRLFLDETVLINIDRRISLMVYMAYTTVSCVPVDPCHRVDMS